MTTHLRIPRRKLIGFLVGQQTDSVNVNEVHEGRTNRGTERIVERRIVERKTKNPYAHHQTKVDQLARVR